MVSRDKFAKGKAQREEPLQQRGLRRNECLRCVAGCFFFLIGLLFVVLAAVLKRRFEALKVVERLLGASYPVAVPLCEDQVIQDALLAVFIDLRVTLIDKVDVPRLADRVVLLDREAIAIQALGEIDELLLVCNVAELVVQNFLIGLGQNLRNNSGSICE